MSSEDQNTSGFMRTQVDFKTLQKICNLFAEEEQSLTTNVVG